jgi:hypothetical protein
MTPKEKAKDLMKSYDFVYIPNYTSIHDVKDCALIAVDEMLHECFDMFLFSKCDYWQEVRQEIEKL